MIQFRSFKRVKQNIQEALKLLEKACDLGEGIGCFNLGFLYYQGNIVKQDYKESTKYHQKGCDLDDFRSCDNLGGLYQDGEGVKQDYQETLKYFQKGCSLGSSIGCAAFEELQNKLQNMKE